MKITTLLYNQGKTVDAPFHFLTIYKIDTIITYLVVKSKSYALYYNNGIINKVKLNTLLSKDVICYDLIELTEDEILNYHDTDIRMLYIYTCPYTQLSYNYGDKIFYLTGWSIYNYGDIATNLNSFIFKKHLKFVPKEIYYQHKRNYIQEKLDIRRFVRYAENILSIYYKDKFTILNRFTNDVYFVINLGDLIVKRDINDTDEIGRVVKDFHAVYLYRDNNIYIQCFNTSFDVDQLISHSIHPHVSTDYSLIVRNFHNYCLGSSYYAHIQQSFNMAESIDEKLLQFEYLILSAKDFFSHESEEGGPYKHFRNYVQDIEYFFQDKSINITKEFITNLLDKLGKYLEFTYLKVGETTNFTLNNINIPDEEFIAFIKDIIPHSSIVNINGLQFRTSFSKEELIKMLKERKRSLISSTSKYSEYFPDGESINIEKWVEDNYIQSDLTFNVQHFKKTLIEEINLKYLS